MERPSLHDAVLEPARSAASVDRRKFLLRLGLLVGAGAGLPFAARLASPAPARRLEVARPALGTWVRVVVSDPDPSRASRAAEAAFAAIQRVDRQMSIHREDSQIARVNAAAGEHAVVVDRAVIETVERACAAARASAGIYDPTVLPLMKLYGFYGSGRDRYPTTREIDDTLAHMGYRYVVVNRASRTIGITRRGVALDLGSIGKGKALDEAVQAIRGEGATQALVDVGGNVYGLGAPPEHSEGWTVGVLHPATGRIVKTFALRDQAVSTSNEQEQFRILKGIRVGHILDARRGRPPDGPLSVSIVASTGMESDVLSTVAFLLGPDRFRGSPGALQTCFVG